MLKVGLTGGIGCGKSTAVDAFRDLGAKIIDADYISKDLVKAGSPVLEKIVEKFGEDILLVDGGLNRKRLKEIIFHDEKRLDDLEAIIHPKVKAEIIRQISVLKNEPYIIIDIPLLVEKGYIDMFDRIIVVDCLPEQQILRVNKRDNIDETVTKSIMERQVSRDVRLKAATDIIDNLGDIESLKKQVKELHNQFFLS